MAAKFGTSGLRGLVQELLGEPARQHVRAFVQHLRNIRALKDDPHVHIGWDFRDSSPAIVADVAAALRGEQLEPVLCGTLPTPALAFAAITAGAPSIMVTGSHIPADRNGLKFFLPSGEISKQDEEQIAALARRMPPTGPVMAAAAIAEAQQHTRSIALFTGRLQPILASRPLQGWSVGVYQHSSVARDLLVDILTAAGARCTPLGRSDSFIPVDTEAVSEATLQLLAGWSRDGRFDAIVSADGDGDRPLLADSGGQVVRGDFIGMITARFLDAGFIATPVTSNSGIESQISARVERTRVGSPFVIAAMQQAVAEGESRVAGFEANGGFLTATPFAFADGSIAALPTRDCFLPILAVLATAAKQGVGLRELQDKHALPCAAAGRLQNVPVEAAARLLAELAADTRNIEALLGKSGEVASVNTLDGVRAKLRSGGIVHFRASGNAPEFRCYVEEASELAAEKLLAESLAAVSRYVELSPSCAEADESATTRT